MLKENYKPGDKIIVVKPGKFENMTGEIVTNKPGTGFKPLSCDLSPYGTWQLNYADVRPFGKEKPQLEPTEAKPKRAYVKKDKTKTVKQKRKYTKKPKL